MNTELLSRLGELLEHSSHAAKLLVSSEIALNDGEITLTQKYNKEAQSLIEIMTKDIFLEIEEVLDSSSDQTNDYDLPNNLELIKQLADIAYNCGVMLGIVVEDTASLVRKTVEEKLLKSINTVVEIYNQLYNN